jgi:hypothetical protein
MIQRAVTTRPMATLPHPLTRSVSGPRPWRLLRRRMLAGMALVTAAPLLSLLLATGPGVAGAGTKAGPRGSVSLVSQTTWVRSTKGMTLSVSVSSPLPPSQLGLQLTLYNQVTERGYFEQTVNDVIDQSYFTEQPTSPPVMPLTTKGLIQPNGDALVVLRVAPPAVPGRALTAPSNGAVLNLPCGSQCAGVWPLQVSLVDLSDFTPLDKFMTFMVVAPDAAASPLRFSLVVPVGSQPALSPAGTPSVSAAEESRVEQLVGALAENPETPVSLALYPQLADGLAAAAAAKVPPRRAALAGRNAARTALTALRRLTSFPNVEIEQSTYTPTNLSAMAGTHLTTEAATQLGVGRNGLASIGVKATGRPYAAATPIGPGALDLLTTFGVRQVVVPSNSVAPVSPSTWDYPVWAPFKVRGSSAEVDASDSYLEQYLGNGPPVLRAYHLLADLALLYFVEQPPGNRGVTLLAPANWQATSQFFSIVLSGLGTSPIVRPVTLSKFFSQVPAGSDESPILYRSIAATIPRVDDLPVGSIARARVDLGALSSMLPSRSPTIDGLDRLVLLGETTGLSSPTRLSYFGAPRSSLDRESSRISLPANRTITITSLSAKIPISVSSRVGGPLQVDLALSNCPPAALPNSCPSTDLTFQHHVYELDLQPGNRIVEVHVSTRSAGAFLLYLSITTPNGIRLVESRLTIQSTAISGVAVVLTAGAGAFLLMWWGRSVLRRRRGRHARRKRREAPVEVAL